MKNLLVVVITEDTDEYNDFVNALNDIGCDYYEVGPGVFFLKNVGRPGTIRDDLAAVLDEDTKLIVNTLMVDEDHLRGQLHDDDYAFFGR